MICVFTGSITTEPMASEHCESVSGVHDAPPSTVRQIPPCAPPMKMRSGLAGSTAIEFTRPEYVAEPLVSGAGPSGTQLVEELGAPNWAAWRSSNDLGHRSRICAMAFSRA